MRRVLFTILLLAAPLRASDFQPVADIARAAEAAVATGDGARVEAAVDAGLRLPRCAGELSAVVGGSGTVEVGCAEAGWRLYVPVRQQRLQQVYVLKRPLSAGEPIAADALAVETRDVTRLAGGVFAVGAPLEGRTARRALMAGSVLGELDAVSPRLLRRGDAVVLLSRSGGIEVRASGRALAAAGVDERVNVENASSRRVVQGVLLASGEVLVR